MSSMKKSATRKSESGQAMVEFVLCAAILSAALGGIAFLGTFGLRAVSAEIRVRSDAMAEKGERNNDRFRRYVFESAEMARFVINYEKKSNPGGLRFGQVTVKSTAQKGRLKYSAVMALDRGNAPLPNDGQGQTSRLSASLGNDLFGPDFKFPPSQGYPHEKKFGFFPRRTPLGSR